MRKYVVEERQEMNMNEYNYTSAALELFAAIMTAVNSYRGDYMSQYSWAEITTASLPQCK